MDLYELHLNALENVNALFLWTPEFTKILYKIFNQRPVWLIKVDNILLKMVVLTETCKGWKIKNPTYINHTGQWLRILYTVTSVMDQDEPS
jgi:hypothetical protein